MRKRSFMGKASVLAVGCLFTFFIASLALSVPAQANQPAEQAYDHYIGHFGAKNVKPPYITGAINAKYYAAGTCPTTAWCENGDDLLTGGLGKTGLQLAAPPFATPLAPTATELRRNAIHTNYRAVLDILTAGGYGTLYGPNVTNAGVVTTSEGKIPGWEYITYADDGTGRKNVTLMVQIPDSFDPKKACIVTATSSGSRGVYGAIGASGEWGLKEGCAVAYTDKGTGNGLHDLMTNTVGLIDGTRTDAETAGADSIFTADVSDAERAAFNLFQFAFMMTLCYILAMEVSHGEESSNSRRRNFPSQATARCRQEHCRFSQGAIGHLGS